MFLMAEYITEFVPTLIMFGKTFPETQSERQLYYLHGARSVNKIVIISGSIAEQSFRAYTEEVFRPISELPHILLNLYYLPVLWF